MSSLQIQGLAVRFGRHEVLRGLDLQVDEGEFLVLLGPSGCGKSTLLHAIAGLQEVQAGRILIGGHDMTEAEPAARGIGMVFQNYALYPTMTVQGNLAFGLRVAGVPRAEVAARVARVAELLQLGPLLARRPAQLSGGQRQRVAIGRALVRECAVFLLDEPLSNLDAQLRAELRRELKLLHQRLGCTMVHVTHDQAEAMTLATRIVVMRDGAIQQVGTPDEVYRRPANRFVAGFLGSPAMNLLDGELGGDRGTVFQSAALRLDLAAYDWRAAPQPGRPVVLGLRPEQVHLRADGCHAAQVQWVETLGSQRVVWLDMQGRALAALQPGGDAAPAPAAPCRFEIETASVSVFDAAGGQRL